MYLKAILNKWLWLLLKPWKQEQYVVCGGVFTLHFVRGWVLHKQQGRPTFSPNFVCVQFLTHQITYFHANRPYSEIPLTLLCVLGKQTVLCLLHMTETLDLYITAALPDLFEQIKFLHIFLRIYIQVLRKTVLHHCRSIYKCGPTPEREEFIARLDQNNWIKWRPTTTRVTKEMQVGNVFFFTDQIWTYRRVPINPNMEQITVNSKSVWKSNLYISLKC